MPWLPHLPSDLAHDLWLYTSSIPAVSRSAYKHISLPHVFSFLLNGSTCLSNVYFNLHTSKAKFWVSSLKLFHCVFWQALLMATQCLPLLTRISEWSFHLYFSLTHIQSIRKSYHIDLKNTPSICVPLATSTAISLVQAPPPLTWVSFGLAHLLFPSCPLS